LVAVYNTDKESLTEFEYRVIDGAEGMWADNSLAEGLQRLFWLGTDMKVWMLSADEYTTISKNIEPWLKMAAAAYMANCIGWFYDNKYFLSYPQSATSTMNDAILCYDVRTGAWFPYTKDWGVNSACYFHGPGDSFELYAGDTGAGYVDRIELPSTYMNRGALYRPVMNTRFDDGDNPMVKKKYWTLFTETTKINFDIVVLTDLGFTSNHDLETITDRGWIGGWIGGWGSTVSDIADENIKQGLKGRYVSLEFTGKNSANESDILLGMVGFEVEAMT
jgi:hypothetical protein